MQYSWQISNGIFTRFFFPERWVILQQFFDNEKQNIVEYISSPETVAEISCDPRLSTLIL